MIECEIDDGLKKLEENLKKTIKDKYMDIVENEVGKRLDKTSLNEKKEISDSLQIKKGEKIEDFMKKLNREIKIKIDANKN